MAQIQDDRLDLKKRAEDAARQVDDRLIREVDKAVLDLPKIKIDMSVVSAATMLSADLPFLQSASKAASELDTTLKRLPTLNEADKTNASKNLSRIGFELGIVKRNIEGTKLAIPSDAPIEKASRSLSAVQTALDNYQPFSMLSPSTWGNIFSESKLRDAVQSSWKQFRKDFAPLDELSKSLKPLF